MRCSVIWGLAIVLCANSVITLSGDTSNEHVCIHSESELPRVFVALFAKDAAITLAAHLECIERLDYPKEKVSVYVSVSPNSEDDTTGIIQRWSSKQKFAYNRLDVVSDSVGQTKTRRRRGPHAWDDDATFKSIIDAREKSFRVALDSDCEFYFAVDADVFLTESSVLRDLLRHKVPIVSPMLHVEQNSFGSNFWVDVDEHGYYKRGSTYLPILRYQKQGLHTVSAMHSAVLIDLKSPRASDLSYSRRRAFDKEPALAHLPEDDVVIFSSVARFHGVQQYVTNEKYYGIMMDPLATSRTYQDEAVAFDALERNYLRSNAATFLTDNVIPSIYDYARRQGAALSSESGFESAFEIADRWTHRTHSDAYAELCASDFPPSFGETEMDEGVEVLHRDPKILRFRDFVSATEIKTLKDLATSRLEQSVVFNKSTGRLESAAYRTSSVAWLDPSTHPIVSDIVRRFERWTGLNASSAEHLQIQRYVPNGGEYQPHVDYGDVKFPDRWNELKGNRIASLIIYLNDGYDGGATVFTRARVKVRPRRGDALFWYNLLPASIGDFRTKHAGCPAWSGDGAKEKWIANLWIRELGNRWVYGLWGGVAAASRGD